MRRSLLAVAAGAALLCLAPFAALESAAATPTAHPVPATSRIVVRPVNSSGHPTNGFHAKKVKGVGPVYCDYPSASPSAVDDDIISCSPDAAYAIACWKAASAHHVLCLTNPTGNRLNEYKVDGKIAHAKAPKHRGPLGLLLADGTKCTIRDGGAGATLRQHHSWAATYYCSQGQAVWAPFSSKNYGVHHSGHVATVELASDNGKQHVHKVRVSKEYLVGTA